MTRQTMITQIVTMSVAGMATRNDLPDTYEKFMESLVDSCAGIMEEPATEDEIAVSLNSGIPVDFVKTLLGIYNAAWHLQ